MRSFSKILKNEDLVYKLVDMSVSNQESLCLTYLNQHCFNIYQKDSYYKNLLDNTFTVFLDGFGVYSALRFLGYKNVQKFNATDLYKKIFQYFAINNTKIFLIGGHFSEDLISRKAKENKLIISGYHNGYFKEDDLTSIIERIETLSPEVIVLGIGVPKQEIIAAKIASSIQNKTILCVGGFLEFYFGTKKRSPTILRLIGLEWLHRFATEPARLWKRYLLGIPAFLFQIVKLKLLTRDNNYIKNSTFK